MIKVVICDGDGTLELPNPSNQTQQMLKKMDQLGIQLAVASNARNRRVVEKRFQNAGLAPPNIIVTRSDIGEPKPKPDFVFRIQEIANVKPWEVVYLGDDDNTDTFCAINAQVLPFSAHYSPANKPRKYGLPVHSPKSFQDFLSTYGIQDEPYFGWTYDSTCQDTNSPITVRVLLGDHEGHTQDMKTILKERGDIYIGSNKNSLRSILFHYLLSQCYLSGLIHDVDFWIVYPGHRERTVNELLASFCETAALVFRDRPLEDLLIRHEDAPESKAQHERNIHDQFRTIHVNPEHRNKIAGRRILVLDDFTTSGHSLETARRMLMQAGAKEVVCVAFGKYRASHARTIISKDWDPYKPCTLTGHDITVFHPNGTFNREADDYFWNNILAVYSN